MPSNQREQDHFDFIIDTASGNTRMPSMHFHASYELYYLEMGSREYFVEDKMFSVSAGDFVLISPGMLHRTGGEYGVRVLVGFKQRFLTRVYTQEAIDHLLKCFERLKVTPSHNQQSVCKSYLKRMAASTDETELALMLGLLLTELSKCKNEEIHDGYVSTIVAYINQNYATISNIGQIADHFFISKYHLCRIFKSTMKVTIIDYLNQIRIKNACQMLDFSGRDIGEISELCGYNSVAYFSNVFKKITGVAPSRYRRESHMDALSAENN